MNISDGLSDVNTTVTPNVNIPRNDSGTSFATPMVAGTAALLMQRGLDLPGPSNRNHLAIKSIILNSARKSRHLWGQRRQRYCHGQCRHQRAGLRR